MAFRAVCFVARLAKGVWPLAAPRFAHPIPESHRRNRVGLNQRFLNASQHAAFVAAHKTDELLRNVFAQRQHFK
jgi:hypothetical protein